MPLTSDDWADAFAKEARSDWSVFLLLNSAKSGVETCHWLHYLQMATEKAGKSYQMRASHDPASFAKSHIAFEKGLNSFLNGPRGKNLMAHLKGDARTKQKQKYRQIALDVEKLAPANDRENTPENVEYPWSSRDASGNDCLKVPCEHSFAIESDIQKNPNFLKVLAEFVERA